MYGYIGSMMAKPGKRDEAITIMLEGVDGLRSVGCLQYTVGASSDDESHAALRTAALASGDFAEGVRAFLERRPPNFS